MVILLFLLVAVQGSTTTFTVSGFSSGAFFSHQLHVAYSNSITGAGVVAGGPFNCSMGSLVRVDTACTLNAYLLDVTKLTTLATQAASAGLIDDVNNLQNDRVYIFSGLLDAKVLPSVVSVTEQFYRAFIHNDYKVYTVYNYSAAHAWVSDIYGNPCWAVAWPGINNCGYDLAGDMLAHVFANANFKPRGTQIPGNLVSFDQANYVDIWQAGMSTRGWTYLPQYCITNVCPVHLNFHGCSQYYDNPFMGKSWITQTGLNEWAETNDIIIIYPQTVPSTNNPDGCWDFWGYTGSNFAYQSGLQMQAAFAMAQKPPYVNWA